MTDPITSTAVLSAEGTTGFNPDGWTALIGTAVQLPGLDPNFRHVLTAVDIAADRSTATVTVLTYREPGLDLARHLSILPGPKAMVRAVDPDGRVLAEGAFDAPLQPGQPVWVNGIPHTVTAVEHPHRHPELGTVEDGLDWQVAAVEPLPAAEPITPAV